MKMKGHMPGFQNFTFIYYIGQLDRFIIVSMDTVRSKIQPPNYYIALKRSILFHNKKVLKLHCSIQ